MADFNKVLLMGNLTRDPEVRYGSGTERNAVCKFGLAVNRRWRNANGDQQEEVTFVDVVVFGRQGDTCGQYLSKGRPVFVEGRLSLSSWEDRETGQKRSRLEVVGERVQFLGSRNDGAGGGGGGGGGAAGNQRDSAQGGGYRDRAPQRAPAPASETRDAAPAGIDYDDIPF